MIEDHSQENNAKSSFFSRSSHYQLDVNSVYSPKYSNLMLDKPFSKPFYSRNDERPTEKVNLAAKSCDSITPPEESNTEKHTRDSTPECNVELSSPTKKDDPNEANFPLEPEVLINESVSQVDLLSTDDNEDSVENKLTPSSASERLPSATPADAAPPSISIPPTVSEPSKLNLSSATVAHSLMELPPSVYLPPFHPVHPVILSPSVTAFSPTPFESLVNPLLVSQIFPQTQQQQPRKPFPRSKNKRINSFSQPIFQENGLYGLGVSQNGTNKEYYVMVHVEAGATLSIRTGDQEQQIPGMFCGGHFKIFIHVTI